MQNNRMLPSEEPSIFKSRRKEAANSQYDFNVKGFQEPFRSGKKDSRKVLKNRAPAISQQLESSPLDSSSANEYRALRKKYLVLEEESFMIGKELLEVEDDVKALEEEKLALLDELVVLEGLIDPSQDRPSLPHEP